MAEIYGHKIMPELVTIDQVAIMRQADPIGRIDIERLGFCGR